MELGSEYSLDVSSLTLKENNLFSYLKEFEYTFFYDSGRSAIRQFAKLLKENQVVLLPEFICESVINCFSRDNIKFYKVHSDFTVDIEDLERKISVESTVIFLMHYFGKLQPRNVLKRMKALAEEYSCIILEDTTHSIFSASKTIGDYMVCSIRKWMPISQGGVLYVANDKIGVPEQKLKKSEDNQRIVGFILKEKFLNNELDCNEEYREIFADCEELLDRQEEEFLLSDLNRFIIGCIDVEELVRKRKENASSLLSLIKKYVMGETLKYDVNECPFAIPMRVPFRDDFRKYLMENKIYCAVHWPFDGIMGDARKQAVDNAKELISLPIDQRYRREHMEYMVRVISKYGGELRF